MKIILSLTNILFMFSFLISSFCAANLLDKPEIKNKSQKDEKDLSDDDYLSSYEIVDRDECRSTDESAKNPRKEVSKENQTDINPNKPPSFKTGGQSSSPAEFDLERSGPPRIAIYITKREYRITSFYLKRMFFGRE